MTGDILDFSRTEADFSSLIFKSLFMLAVWIILLSLTRKACTLIALSFWSHPIPVERALIPSELPHPNPPGGAIPFGIPLLNASEKEIDKFMMFVHKNKLISRETPTKNKQDTKWSLQDVAICAAAYKGQLVSE